MKFINQFFHSLLGLDINFSNFSVFVSEVNKHCQNFFISPLKKHIWYLRNATMILKTSWRRIENVTKLLVDILPWRIYSSYQDVLASISFLIMASISFLIMKSGRRLEDVFWRWRRNVSKTSSRQIHQDQCLLGRPSEANMMGTTSKIVFFIEYFAWHGYGCALP